MTFYILETNTRHTQPRDAPSSTPILYAYFVREIKFNSPRVILEPAVHKLILNASGLGGAIRLTKWSVSFCFSAALQYVCYAVAVVPSFLEVRAGGIKTIVKGKLFKY